MSLSLIKQVTSRLRESTSNEVKCTYGIGQNSGVASGGASCPPRKNSGEKWGNGAFGGKWGKEGKSVKATNLYLFKRGFPRERSSIIAFVLNQNTHF